MKITFRLTQTEKGAEKNEETGKKKPEKMRKFSQILNKT